MGAYEIIQADVIEHKPDVLGIINRNLGAHSENWYSWKYKDVFGGAGCFLAKDISSGNFVGEIALFRRKFRLDGKLAQSAVCGDFAVDRRHRAYGPAMRLIKAVLDKIEDYGIAFIYSLPNKLSAALLEKAGYEEAGKMQRYVKVLKTGSKIKRYIKMPFLAELVAILLDSAVFILSREMFYRGLPNASIKELSSFDNRIDDLWIKSQGQFMVAGERSSDFLNWRYFKEGPRHKMLALTRGNEILSYIVYRAENNNVYIMDMLAADSEALKTHISKVISCFRRNGIDSISINYFGGDKLIRILREFNFMPREEGLKVLYYTNDSRKKEMLSDAQNWYFMQGDNDA